MEVSSKTQENWVKAYNDPEWIVQEIFKAMAWLTSNPKRQKKNISRFLTNWLARSASSPKMGGEMKGQAKSSQALYHKQAFLFDVECKVCNGDGFVQAESKLTKAVQSLRCSCEAGKQTSSSLPFYQSRDYILLS